MFPLVEPIPLPAPVWLFKVLGLATLSLHFLAVHLLLGGLLVATWWALVGRWRRRAVMIDAAGSIANRLPIIMVYVINLGVPPLLFAQVLYGRGIYTSSILIGAIWISVIFLLMLVYALLYVMAGRARKGLAWGWIGVVAFLVAAKIAMIYTTNMTLMIRPQVWSEMYQADGFGLHLNSGDPTVLPRWLFMVFGALATAGAGLVLMGLSKEIAAETGRFVRTWGSRLAVGGIIVQICFGGWTMMAQPAAVKSLLGDYLFYEICMGLWLLLALLVLVAALACHANASEPNWKWAGVLGGATVLEVVMMVISRSGIQDLTLLTHGMNIWDRQVHNNWIVTGVFLVLFVFGLAAVSWLIAVVARAKRVEQRYV